MKKLNKIIQLISNLEQELSYKNDEDALTNDEKQLREMLNFCYDLLARSEVAQNDKANLVFDYDEYGRKTKNKVYRFALMHDFKTVDYVIDKINSDERKGNGISF